MKPTRLILILAAIALIAFVSYQRYHRPENTLAHGSGDNDLIIHSIPVFHSLALGKFDIEAKGIHEVKITMDPSLMRNARLIGHFASTNGPAIQVLLLDETQYTKFKQDHAPADILFMSKTVPSGDIEAALPQGGTYYLVFDNSGSDTVAHLEADVTLRYETVQVDSGAENKK